MPEPVKDFAIAQGSETFISGGITKSGPTNSVYVISQNGLVRHLPPMLEARALHSLILFEGDDDMYTGNKIYAIGGSNNLIERYDASNQW